MYSPRSAVMVSSRDTTAAQRTMLAAATDQSVCMPQSKMEVNHDPRHWWDRQTGQFVIQELRRRGRAVRVLARPQSAAQVSEPGVEVALGDLGDPDSLLSRHGGRLGRRPYRMHVLRQQD